VARMLRRFVKAEQEPGCRPGASVRPRSFSGCLNRFVVYKSSLLVYEMRGVEAGRERGLGAREVVGTWSEGVGRGLDVSCRKVDTRLILAWSGLSD
jgi:hypothetical protein